MIFCWVFCVFYGVALVLLLRKPRVQKVRFHNSLKLITVYVALQLLVVMQGAFVSTYIIASGEPLNGRVDNYAGGRRTDQQLVTLKFATDSYIGIITSGLGDIANLGIAFLYLFAIMAISFSLKYEKSCLEAVQTRS